MQDIKKLLQQALETILKDLEVQDVIVELEKPRDETHGEYASNIAMRLSGILKKAPLEIAEEVADKLKQIEGINEIVDEIKVAPPGFINFKVNKNEIKKIIDAVNSDYGKSDLGKGKKIMIEFGQPNTHKAFHVGHLKSAISGLAMVRLHENLGYEVIKANYFGDVGMHVAKTTWGFLKKGEPQDFATWDIHKKMEYIDECYVFGSSSFKDDPIVEAEVRVINKEVYAKADTESYKIYKKLREYSIEHQNDVWKSLGVKFDREYPESEVYEKAVEIVKANIGEGKVFQESQGSIIFKGEDQGLNNWVFLTSEGNPTYSAKDLALAEKKFEEYPDLFKGIVTTSVEQKDYFRAVIKVLETINPITKGRYFHIPFGWMLRGGKKFSSRMGTSVKGMEVLTEVKEMARKKVDEIEEYPAELKDQISHTVANAGLKFLILSHEFYKDFSYEPEKFLSFQGFSGPYLLYTYARAKSILAKAGSVGGEYNLETVLNKSEEQDLLKSIQYYPQVASDAGVEIAPHLIANYLYDLAQKFNQFYTNCPVLVADTVEDKNARLKLTAATAQVLKNGLNLLGIETVEKM